MTIMKMNAEKLYLASSAILTIALLSTPASATKSLNTADKPSTFTANKSYTASGKMDRKMALMLTNLLRNPHLQVRAEINGKPLQTISPQVSINKSPMDVLTNYTITGKTDKKTVLKLKKMLQSGQPLDISAQVNFNTHTPRRVANAPRLQNPTHFMPSFTPFYSNISPPAYIQGNTVWVPVLINQTSAPIVNTTQQKAEMFAGK